MLSHAAIIYFSYDNLKQWGINPLEKVDTAYYRTSSRFNIYTEDLNSEQVKNGYKSNSVRRILLNDKSFNSNAYKTEVFITKKALASISGLRTLLQVKSAPSGYYIFLNSYEQHDPSLAYNNSSAPVRIQDNVVNGQGMVGGVYRQQFVYFF